MTVKRAAVLGRCMGVRRAVDLARQTAASETAPGGQGRHVFTLGPLIHNPRTVAELEAAGIRAIEVVFSDGEGGSAAFTDSAGSPVDPSGSVVVIRAHGVSPRVTRALEAAGAEVIDATCPRVHASQARAARKSAEGWTVVIAGDRDHGEVAGVAGFAPGAIIVGSAAEAAAIEGHGPFALIAQTTIRREEYLAIRDALAERCAAASLDAVDSICPATAERRAALTALAAEVDALVVVGGRNSANTTRLHATALETGLPAFLVEGADELPDEVFRFARVGVTAGASTPDEAIDEVEAALLKGNGSSPAP